MLALHDRGLAEKLEGHKKKMAAAVRKKNENL